MSRAEHREFANARMQRDFVDRVDSVRLRRLCITIPTIAAVGGGIASAVIGGNAAEDAANTQADAAKSAQAASQAQYQQTRSDLAPYRAVGDAASPTYQALLGIGSGSGSAPNMAQVQAALAQTPGYQFALQQGTQATQNGFAAQGLGISGASLKGAANYAEGLAGTTYQSILGNYYNAMGLGESAAAQTGALGATLTGQANAAGTSAAAASAAGTVGAANATIGGINSALGGVNNAMLLSSLNSGGLYGNAGYSNNPFTLSSFMGSL